MFKPFSLIIALVVEIIVLIFILIVVLVGVLGIFLPIMPGLFFIGLGAAIYSLLIKNNYGRITPQVHWRLLKIKEKILTLKITQNFMGLIKQIKKRREEKAKEEILKQGLILLGFNFALILAFFFGFNFLAILASLIGIAGLAAAFVPLVVIFLFAGSSAIVWYRYGQILGTRFKTKKVLNTSLVVLISILPLLVLLLVFSALVGLTNGFSNELLAVSFLGLLLMSVLSAIFELLIVSIGATTAVK
ncbi:MAG: hypothetical protein WC768_05510 [Patescibacteria group bacterium]|jgi:hypothetical protein